MISELILYWPIFSNFATAPVPFYFLFLKRFKLTHLTNYITDMSWQNPLKSLEKGIRSVGNSLGQAGKSIISGTANAVGNGVGYLHEGTGIHLFI